MNFQKIYASVSAGKDHLLARFVKDLNSHRSVWNYIYMALYVFIALYLTIRHGTETGAMVIATTGGVVTAIFTNTVWSKTVEKKMEKENANVNSAAKPATDPEEDGAGE